MSELDYKRIIVTPNYNIKVTFIEDDILHCEKSHIYKKSTHVDSYASDYFMAYSNLPPGRVKMRSGLEYIELSGPTLIYLPPFSIVETQLEPGPLTWECISFTKPLSCSISEPKYLRVPSFQRPKNKSEIGTLLKQLETGNTIIQEKFPSAVAEKLKSYIDNHFCDDLKMSLLEQELGYSRVVMSRYFKKSYGLSPTEYRHKIRVHEALIKIRLGSSITEALYHVGFSDPSQFNIQFKKILKTNPSNYNINSKSV